MPALNAATPAAAATLTTTASSKWKDKKHHACSEFLAGDELVTIVPSFSYPKPLELISRPSVGPFQAGLETSVPLWLALLLRQKCLCRIQAPSWMDVSVLRSILHEEQTTETFSKRLPFRYLETSRSLLATSESVTDQPDAVRILLQDISTVRTDKIRRNLHTLSEQALATPHTLPVIEVTGISSLEIATVAPFCTKAFQHHLLLSRPEPSTLPKQKTMTSSQATSTTSSLSSPRPAPPSRVRRRFR